jgi:hypothetical protein
MRGCGDGRVPLFWVADIVVATNSLVVIVAVCASVFTSRPRPRPRRCEVAISGVANRFKVISSSSSLSVATTPPGDEDNNEDVMQLRCRPRRRNGGATTPNAIAASWRPRSGLPNPRRKSARATFLTFALRSLAGCCVDASSSRPLESTSSPSLALPSLALPSSLLPPLSTLRPSPALLNARLQCGRPRIGRRHQRPSNNDALPPAPHRCTAVTAPTTLHSHISAKGAIADIPQTPHQRRFARQKASEGVRRPPPPSFDCCVCATLQLTIVADIERPRRH